MAKDSLPKPEAWRLKEKRWKRLLRKRRAMPRARATFADVVVVADVVEKLETGAGVGRARTAAKYAARPVANHATNHETNALTAATVRDAAGRTRDSSGRRRRLLALVATTITDHPRDINRSCFPANRSRSTSGRGWVRVRDRLCRGRVLPWRSRWRRRRSLQTFLKMSLSLRRRLPSLFTNSMSMCWTRKSMKRCTGPWPAQRRK